ncbi:MAG: hypothetical protein U5L72_12150 [Bacteroidales bacterium]|nr:hypothetical protein [Bacteroidales bacterium]
MEQINQSFNKYDMITYADHCRYTEPRKYPESNTIVTTQINTIEYDEQKRTLEKIKKLKAMGYGKNL